MKTIKLYQNVYYLMFLNKKRRSQFLLLLQRFWNVIALFMSSLTIRQQNQPLKMLETNILLSLKVIYHLICVLYILCLFCIVYHIDTIIIQGCNILKLWMGALELNSGEKKKLMITRLNYSEIIKLFSSNTLT